MRIVIRVRPAPLNSGMPALIHLEQPSRVVGAGVPTSFDPTPIAGVVDAFRKAAADNAATTTVGDALMLQLVENAGIKNALLQTAGTPSAAAEGIVLDILDLGRHTVDDLPWESLHETQAGFFALKDWPIARIVRDIDYDQQHGEGIPFDLAFDGPLRVAAILGADGWDALEEWNAIEKTLVHGGAQVLVVTSDLSVLAAATVAAANVTVRPIPADRDALVAMVKSFRAHVLHFFCHGKAGPDPHLLVATEADKAAGTSASMILETSDVSNMVADFRPFLVLLGCCEGAQAGPQGHSLARRLVQGRFHAAIGMGERVEFASLHRFTERFFSRLMTALSQVSPSLTTLDLNRLLLDPRNNLAGAPNGLRDPDKVKAWVAPVLFCRPELLRIQKQSADTLEMAALLRASVDTVPSDLRAAVAAKILALGNAV